jgi:GAF domain-containing protein
VPLVLGARVLGALGLALSKRHQFAAEEVGLLQTLAGHAAVAIENARLFEAAQAQAHELTALDEVRTALTSTLELTAVLESIGEWAIKLTGADGSAVFELDARTLVLNPRTSRILAPTEVFVHVPLKIGQGAAGLAAVRRAPVWSADIAADPLPGYAEEVLGDGRSLAAVVEKNAYRAVLAIPVVSRETVLGAFCLYWNVVHEPTAREIRFLTAFAQQAAVALENARLYQALEDRLNRQQALTRVTRLISGSLDVGTVLTEISKAAARLMNSPMALFWVADSAQTRLEFAAASDPELATDFPFRETSFDQGVVGWVAAHRTRLAVADVFADSRFGALDWWKGHGLRSFLGLPVVLDDTVLAVLTINSRESFQLTAADNDLLDSFVAQAALAIRNAKLFEAEARGRREVELALAQVKQLQGMLPICAYCKKVRNDANYWETIEGYIGERSAATFSHGICPECRDKVVGPEIERWKRSQQGP